MKNLINTISSMETAELIGKEHNMLLRDIKRYLNQLGQSNIAQSDFFTEGTYKNSQNKTLPCYHVTKKGCEFIAHKLTGIKGTEFTARYINRFHEMEYEIRNIPAASNRKITFIQEIKAAEYVVKGLDQRQKLEF